MQFTEYEALKLLPPFDEDDEPPLRSHDATLKDRDAVLELDGILVELPEPESTETPPEWARSPAQQQSTADQPALGGVPRRRATLGKRQVGHVGRSVPVCSATM